MRIYADRKFLPEGTPHCEMLIPFWGENPQRGDDFVEEHRFDVYRREGRGIFSLESSVQEADILILPFNWAQVVNYQKNHPQMGLAEAREQQDRLLGAAVQLDEIAGQSNKLLVVFLTSDDPAIPVPLEHAIVFRPSLEAASVRSNERAIPGFRDDFLRAYREGRLRPREKLVRPTVGYCGYENVQRRSRRDQIKQALGRVPRLSQMADKYQVSLIRHPGARVRAQAIYKLRHTWGIKTNFVLRDAFWNGAVSRHDIQLELARRSRLEYVDNMMDSDYVLCARGNGNYSFRFYETLSSGRLPLFINTDCVLPYADHVHYQDLGVWVEERDIPWIGSLLRGFHRRMSSEEFVERQQRCREVWEEWLSPTGFFKHFYLNFTDGAGS